MKKTFAEYRAEADANLKHLSPAERDEWAQTCVDEHPGGHDWHKAHEHKRPPARYNPLEISKVILLFLILLTLVARGHAQDQTRGVQFKGAVTPGDCVQTGSSRFFVVDTGSPCGAGGGGR